MEYKDSADGSCKKASYYIKEIMQWVQAIVIAVVVALLIRAFIFEPVEVDGHSMNDTLHDGEKLILYKLGYRFSPPQRGDIVVLEIQKGFFQYIPILDMLPFWKNDKHYAPEVDYIKRVIGVPGDVIDLKDGYVYVNGIKISEPYVKGLTFKKTMEFPVTVPENKVFVLGDNREYSSDSRFVNIGFIEYDRIKGKAILRYWPLNKLGGLYDNLKYSNLNAIRNQ